MSTFPRIPLIMSLLLLGCDNCRSVVFADDANAVGSHVAKNEEQIQAGFGIPTCHIGMRDSELVTDWAIPVDPVLSEFRTNPAHGIEAEICEGMVLSVFFFYLSKDLLPFHGSTDTKISDKSSITDVLIAYGDPSYVTKCAHTKSDDFPGAIQLDVNYFEKGIYFQFLDGRLAHILVTRPRKDVDYGELRRHHLESDIYIRNRKVEKPEDELRSFASDLEKASR
jgi:hypothetical protein